LLLDNFFLYSFFVFAKKLFFSSASVCTRAFSRFLFQYTFTFWWWFFG
jgi:hypothetical protein